MCIWQRAYQYEEEKFFACEKIQESINCFNFGIDFDIGVNFVVV